MTHPGTQRILPGVGELLPAMPLPPVLPPDGDPAPATTYMIEYAYRSDHGPRRVGPFDTADQAQAHAWSKATTGWTSAYNVVPVTSPEADA